MTKVEEWKRRDFLVTLAGVGLVGPLPESEIRPHIDDRLRKEAADRLRRLADNIESGTYVVLGWMEEAFPRETFQGAVSKTYDFPGLRALKIMTYESKE